MNLATVSSLDSIKKFLNVPHGTFQAEDYKEKYIKLLESQLQDSADLRLSLKVIEEHLNVVVVQIFEHREATEGKNINELASKSDKMIAEHLHQDHSKGKRKPVSGRNKP